MMIVQIAAAAYLLRLTVRIVIGVVHGRSRRRSITSNLFDYVESDEDKAERKAAVAERERMDADMAELIRLQLKIAREYVKGEKWKDGDDNSPLGWPS